MGSKITQARIRLLVRLGAFRRLARVLHKLPPDQQAMRADIPFRALDAVLTKGNVGKAHTLAALAKYLPANQPILFHALLNGLTENDLSPLQTIAQDHDMHPLTRFEAIGWLNHLRHRAIGAQKAHHPLPGKLIQFWDTPEIPPEVSVGIAKWRKVPSPGHALFDQAGATAFVREHYGANAARDFENLWHPALQSDLFRLYYIAINGGVYVDADSAPGKSVSLLGRYDPSKVILTATTFLPNCATNNWFIAAPARHPFIEGFLETVLANLARGAHERIYWLSGPGALTLHLHKYGGEVCLLPHGLVRRNLFEQFDAGYKKTALNWRVFEHRKKFSDEDILPKLLSEL